MRQVELRVERGERLLLLGASGAGKSTLLMALAGLLDPRGGGEAEGRLRVDGRDPRAARERTGLLFQDPEAEIVMGRAGDDIAFGLENRCVPTSAIWPRVRAALDAVEFPYGLDHATTSLSGGEKQRLALAGTLALGPALLLLDEPTANLDPVGAAAFRAVLPGAMTQLGATLVLVDHRVDESIDLVDRVVVLGGESGVIEDGPPSAVFGRHGAALADAGIWVPGYGVRPPPRPQGSPGRGETLLLAEAAGYSYPGAQPAPPAVAGIDAQIRVGEALAVTGPNGSGKTTLALMLGGLLRPRAGRVVASEALAPGHGQDPIWRWDAGRLAGRIGSVFQDPEHQFLTGSVRDELRIGPLVTGLDRAEAESRADVLLERLSLGHLAAASPFSLSGGEKRRLSVGTALATAPRVLILDEPTYGQDRRTWAEVLYLLGGLRNEGRALVVASHDREFVQAIADRTLRLGNRHAA